jgi:hypothetical protein
MEIDPGPTELATLFFAIFREDEKNILSLPYNTVFTLFRASASQPQRLSCIIPHLTYHNKDIVVMRDHLAELLEQILSKNHSSTK